MRVLHVITGVWKHTGGPSEVIPALCTAMVEAGERVTLATIAGEFADSVAESEARGVRVVPFAPTIRHTAWYSRELQARLPELVAEHDLVHIHGIWQFPDWAAAASARRAGVPYVVTPHGSLQPARLRKSRLKKRVSTVLADRAMLNQADCLHATAPDEAEALRLFGYRGPIAVIPNGITQPGPIDPARAVRLVEECARRFPEIRGRRLLLFLSRIEPIKGVTTLARAWAECARDFPDWHLVVAGPDERAHLQEVQAILRGGGVSDRTTITGPLHGDLKTGFYVASDVFVLPTISENFGLVIGEALAHRLPVITTTGAPWPGIVERRCGWWVEPTRAAVTAAIRDALATPRETLAGMGARGAAWMAADFTWEREAAALLETYRWLLGSVPAAPGFVEFEA